MKESLMSKCVILLVIVRRGQARGDGPASSGGPLTVVSPLPAIAKDPKRDRQNKRGSTFAFIQPLLIIFLNGTIGLERTILRSFLTEA